MKKISKLEISHDKLIKNEELINIKGGTMYLCYCPDELYGYGIPGYFYVSCDTVLECWEMIGDTCLGEAICAQY